MSSELINRSSDLSRLRNEGYEVRIHGTHLVIDGVPYVNQAGKIEHASLVSELTLAGEKTTIPSTHVAYFTGSQPCNKNGEIITGLQHGESAQDLGNGLVVQRSFSNKPANGYPDYYEKMKRYLTMICDPAHSVDSTVTAKTFKPFASLDPHCPFEYTDTNSGRAQIGAISAKLERLKIGIVGVGGTGSFVLDLVSKTPVEKIYLFDEDRFFQHNAFRTPGAAPLEKLQELPTKVAYLRELYSKMHRGIIAVPEYITAANVTLLDGLDHVFLCMDASDDKRHIIDFLISHRIPFIDAGLGVSAVDGKLLGIIRVTTVTPDKNDHLPRISCLETAEDDYSSNIQIAELNALNAAMAVLKWKRMLGFYVDYEREHNSTYTLSGNMLLNEDTAA